MEKLQSTSSSTSDDRQHKPDSTTKTGSPDSAHQRMPTNTALFQGPSQANHAHRDGHPSTLNRSLPCKRVGVHDVRRRRTSFYPVFNLCVLVGMQVYLHNGSRLQIIQVEVVQLCEISRSNIAVRSYDLDTDFGYVWTLTLEIHVWPWVRPWQTLSSWTTRLYRIMGGHRFWLCTCMHWPWRYDLELGHYTPFYHEKQLYEILSGSNIAVRSYGPDTDLAMCALWPWPWRYDLHVGSRSWHPWVMDNNRVKNPDQTRG